MKRFMERKAIFFLIFALFLFLAISSVFAEEAGIVEQKMNNENEQVKKALSYENTAMGIKIDCPEGWYMISGKDVGKLLNGDLNYKVQLTETEPIKETQKGAGLLVMFSKHPFGTVLVFNPTISLTGTSLPEGQSNKSPLDYANFTLASLKIGLKEFKLIKEPIELKLAQINAAHFICEGLMSKGYIQMPGRNAVYIFIKDNIIYQLSFFDKPQDFDANFEAFQISLSSLVLKPYLQSNP